MDSNPFGLSEVEAHALPFDFAQGERVWRCGCLDTRRVLPFCSGAATTGA